jgi:opacity protein-like surface antigen
MKKVIIGVVIAAALGAPALAQSYTPEFGTANINPPVASVQGQQDPNSAYAQAPKTERGMRAIRSTSHRR